MQETFETLRGALNTLTPEDMELIFEETRRAAEELNGEEVPQDWFNRRILLRFKAKKYSQIPVQELIAHCLWVLKYDGTPTPNRVRLVPNEAQSCALARLESDSMVSELPKHRQEGITAILAAFCAVRMYLSKTKIVFFSPNGESKRHVTGAVLEFLQQLDASLELTTEDGVFTARSVSNGYIRLYNGSEIRFYTGLQVEPLRGLGEVDYVIFDESDYIKNICDLNAQARIAVRENGKVFNTYTIDEKFFNEGTPKRPMTINFF